MNKSAMMKFVLEKLPMGVVVFDSRIKVIYRNNKADLFFKTYELPVEVPALSRRIFDAISTSRIAELFHGEIYLKKSLGPYDSSTDWTFKIDFLEGPDPLVVVFIMRDSVSSRLDLNKLRPEFNLTRRETDILRRVIDGLKNTEISGDLSISEQTVKDHLSNIYMKVGVENRFDLIRILINSPTP